MQHITRRRYTDDFKAQAILLAESIGPAKAARQLDMSVTENATLKMEGDILKKATAFFAR